MTTPCCTARCSVSTCVCLRQTSTEWPTPSAWLVMPQALLTRGAPGISTRRRHSQYPAKAGNHTLNYGMREFTLAKRLGCSVQEAKDKIDKYLARYPAVKHFFDSAIEEARESGYAFTVLGRRRFLGDILAQSRKDRGHAERQASNMPIQGSAADVCKCAMLLCDSAGLELGITFVC